MKHHIGRKMAAVMTAALVLGVTSVLFLSGCGGTDTASEPGVATQISDSEVGAQAALSDLTVDDQLIFLREEEKLARDVYLFLYDKWGIAEFNTIAGSEVRHMDSVKNLLDRYGLEDPAGSDVPGVFVDAELQAAYDDLVAKGSESARDAIQVGITIEELDIEDLQVLLASTDANDISRVAENLLRGSQNHLASFTSLLDTYSE